MEKGSVEEKILKSVLKEHLHNDLKLHERGAYLTINNNETLDPYVIKFTITELEAN